MFNSKDFMVQGRLDTAKLSKKQDDKMKKFQKRSGLSGSLVRSKSKERVSRYTSKERFSSPIDIKKVKNGRNSHYLVKSHDDDHVMSCSSPSDDPSGEDSIGSERFVRQDLALGPDSPSKGSNVLGYIKDYIKDELLGKIT
jgi:hypothetical protein